MSLALEAPEQTFSFDQGEYKRVRDDASWKPNTQLAPGLNLTGLGLEQADAEELLEALLYFNQALQVGDHKEWARVDEELIPEPIVNPTLKARVGFLTDKPTYAYSKHREGFMSVNLSASFQYSGRPFIREFVQSGVHVMAEKVDGEWVLFHYSPGNVVWKRDQSSLLKPMKHTVPLVLNHVNLPEVLHSFADKTK